MYIEFVYAQSDNFIRNYIVIGTRHRRTGRGGGGRGAAAPPQFGQFVDMNSGRESTLFGQNTIHV